MALWVREGHQNKLRISTADFRSSVEPASIIRLMSAPNYYELLGLAPGASVLEIRRAYHRLARQYHPDVIEEDDDVAERLFQQIIEAYTVLSDPARRREYDLSCGFTVNMTGTGNEQAPDSGRSAVTDDGNDERGELDPSTMRRMLGRASALRRGGGFHTRGWRRVLDPLTSLLVTRSLGGTVSTAPLSKRQAPPAEDVLRGLREYLFTIDALESIRGTKREVGLDTGGEPRVITVRIPAQVMHRELLEIRCPDPLGNGHQVIRARINIVPHTFVERSGNDIVVKLPITIAEAVSGAELKVPVFGGSVSVKLPPLSGGFRRIRVKGKGINNERSSGDLYVLPVIFPPEVHSEKLVTLCRELESAQSAAIRQGLPEAL